MSVELEYKNQNNPGNLTGAQKNIPPLAREDISGSGLFGPPAKIYHAIEK